MFIPEQIDLRAKYHIDIYVFQRKKNMLRTNYADLFLYFKTRVYKVFFSQQALRFYTYWEISCKRKTKLCGFTHQYAPLNFPNFPDPLWLFTIFFHRPRSHHLLLRFHRFCHCIMLSATSTPSIRVLHHQNYPASLAFPTIPASFYFPVFTVLPHSPATSAFRPLLFSLPSPWLVEDNK